VVRASLLFGSDLDPAYDARTPMRLFLSHTRTTREAKRLLERHFVPAFRKRPLPEITGEDIGQELAKIADRPSEQLHAFRVLRTFLRWCIRPPPALHHA
jgi:hypothetical protein